jgi:hypothetical protein
MGRIQQILLSGNTSKLNRKTVLVESSKKVPDYRKKNMLYYVCGV